MRAIVELAKGLGIETVAEYVENEEIAAEIRRLGVDYAQGYAYGKPEPLVALLQSLDEDESSAFTGSISKPSVTSASAAKTGTRNPMRGDLSPPLLSTGREP